MESLNETRLNDLIAHINALQQKNVEEMQEVLATNKSRMDQMTQENLMLHDTITRLEEIVTSFPHMSSITQSREHIIKDPKLSMPEKFDGTRSKFRGFSNQVKLFIRMQPQRYSTEISKVGLIGTLLTGTALAWFGPLNEQNSPLLENFEAFMEEFSTTFGDVDKARMADSKIRELQQGSRPASIYASEFRQLSCDVDWESDMALVRQFYWGLRDDVKDLLLTMPDVSTLAEAISQAVKCDNRLFERRQNKRLGPQIRVPLSSPPSTTLALPSNPINNYDPMQIDSIRYRTLTQDEKDRRRREGLCLYCGEEGHLARDCKKKRRRNSEN